MTLPSTDLIHFILSTVVKFQRSLEGTTIIGMEPELWLNGNVIQALLLDNERIESCFR